VAFYAGVLQLGTMLIGLDILATAVVVALFTTDPPITRPDPIQTLRVAVEATAGDLGLPVNWEESHLWGTSHGTAYGVFPFTWDDDGPDQPDGAHR
jgi:hypothetical protein